ncbi:MAG: hypothetical protein K0R24_1845 [Gammaproteobacteria bacterium]|nr:hypothetical protein [Gammaproteobacteria bacterium]
MLGRLNKTFLGVSSSRLKSLSSPLSTSVSSTPTWPINHSLIVRIVNAAESMKIFESFQEEFPEESKKSEVNAIIGNEIASELTKLEALGYQDAIETGCRLMEKHEILKARKCFNHIVTLLEKERSSEKTFPINNELIAKAYTYRGLAYMVGSPSHREQVL